MRRFSCLFAALVLSSALCHGTFIPIVRNWSQADYDAANQNWALARDSKGCIYVGNHKGLLEFDGFRWILHSMGSPDIVRSLYVDGNDRIYVGARNDFGYFERDSYGRLHYTSLLMRLKDRPDRSDMSVWSIVGTEGKIIFSTYWGYFAFDGQEIECVDAHFQLSRLSVTRDGIYYFHRGQILQFADGKLERPTNSGKKASIKSLVSFFYEPGTLLAVTESDGFLKYDGKTYTRWVTEVDDALKKANPNRAVLTADSLLVIGTVRDGVFALRKNGTLLWHLNVDNGLQDNTVLDILCDRDHNIWLALNYGVSMISGDNTVSIKALDRGMGSVFDVQPFGNHIYVATNQGLFRSLNSSADSDVEPVPGMEGFVLSLYRTDDNVLVAGHSKNRSHISRRACTSIVK